MQKETRNTESLDDFWDISSLVPKRKSAPLPHSREIAEPTELHLPRQNVSDAVPDVPLGKRFVSPEAEMRARFAPKPMQTYTPEVGLLREVRIYPWKSTYDYYEAFCRHAALLADREGEKCPEADFFSYMPQYTQLTAAQLQYYLWWRTNFKRGNTLPAAYSYLLLYLYELINLDEARLSPVKGQELMLRLWLSYRGTYPRLDTLLREWLCDYSLLHHLPPPVLPTDLYRVLLSGCRLKEFYVSAAEHGDAMTVAILLFCNNYDYTKSKFYTDKTREEYDRVLSGAIGVALAHLREECGASLTGNGGVSTVSRDVFAGAVCSCRIKRRIEVDYTSFSHTHDLRFVMTDVLKYAENAIRANHGIKSRLSIYALSVPLRERLDAYLATALTPRAKTTSAARAAVPEYERRYELPVVEISPTRAAEIEANSWLTTKRLVEAFSGEEESVENEKSPETGVKNDDFSAFAPMQPPCEPESGEEEGFAAALGDLLPFVQAALKRDKAAQRQVALSRGEMTDAVADRINTIAAELLGDILLEEDNGVYVVLEDYLEFLEEQGVN